MTDRVLAVPGLHNARDLGGLPTSDGGAIEPGRLFRSAAPHALAPEAQAELPELRTAIDLREPAESATHPPNLEHTDAEVLALPIVDGQVNLRRTATLDAFYTELLRRCGPQFARAAAALARPDALPAIVFCSAGKDRTGMLTALVLAAVGVPDEEIVADYELTKAAIDDAFKAELVRRAEALGFSEQIVALASDAPARLMREVLAQVRQEHGGAAAYLRAHGLAQHDLDALRAGLVAAAA